MEESILNHSVTISGIEDCEDDMQICKGDIDSSKILLTSMGWDVEMLEVSVGSVQQGLASAQRDIQMLEGSMGVPKKIWRTLEAGLTGVLRRLKGSALSARPTLNRWVWRSSGFSRSPGRRSRAYLPSSSGSTPSSTRKPYAWMKSWIGSWPWLGSVRLGPHPTN